MVGYMMAHRSGDALELDGIHVQPLHTAVTGSCHHTLYHSRPKSEGIQSNQDRVEMINQLLLQNRSTERFNKSNKLIVIQILKAPGYLSSNGVDGDYIQCVIVD